MVREIRSRGMRLSDGASEFGVPVSVLYEYNRVSKQRDLVSETTGSAGSSGEVADEEKKAQSNAESEPGDTPAGADGVAPKVGAAAALADEEENRGSGSPELPKGPGRLPADLESLIVGYRTSHPDHGYRRIEEWLKRDHLVVVPRKTIRRVLKARGLHTSNDSSFEKRSDASGKGTRRFEASCARSLYQMDIAYVYITGVPVLYLVVVVDDYSRYCVAAQLCDRCSGSMMIEVLHGAIERHGKPERVLTDQGSSFYTWSYEPTLFQRYLDDMRIEHLVSDPHSPQTAGKVERLIQTIRRELLEKRRFDNRASAREGLERFIQAYNYGRGHQSLGGQSPSSRFHGVESETGRIEASLADKQLDFSRGYLVLKSGGHTVSVVQSASGIGVYLDGDILKRGGADECGEGQAA